MTAQKFEPIADDLLNLFEQDCANSQDRDRRSNLPGQSTTMMKYFGQTIARLRVAEAMLAGVNQSLDHDKLVQYRNALLAAVRQTATATENWDRAFAKGGLGDVKACASALAVASASMGFIAAIEAIRTEAERGIAAAQALAKGLQS